jgi:hypothetical protein
MSTQARSGKPTAEFGFRWARKVVLKALLLLLIANLLFAALDPLPWLARISAYNLIIPGRHRLPYGENPELAYNLSLFQLEAMFASHELSAGHKPEDEYRVLLIGDSSVWGFLLTAEQTATAYLNQAAYTTEDGRTVRAYNLGYPVMSLLKDVAILDWAMAYQPDMIVWLVTLESFPHDKQLASPLIQHNPEIAQTLIEAHDLDLDPQHPDLVRLSFWERTIIGQRRALADLIRLQLYGVLWAATGVDHAIPEEFDLRAEDLVAEVAFHGIQPPQQVEDILSLDVLQAGMAAADPVPIILVNQPMFLSRGENSDIRYNFHYPRWAYDAYRAWLSEQCERNAWRCLDYWNAIDPEEFTNTAFHLTPGGSAQLAGLIGEAILEQAAASNP